MAKVDKRKTHITRIFGTNRSGDVLSDIWIDVERIENVKSATQTQGGFWQEVQRKLRWMDDPNGDDYAPDGNPTRDEVVIKVCDPNAGNVNDPDEWVEVRAIKSLKSHGGSAGDQDYKDRLINDEVTEARKVEVRKIVHYDTNIDDDATAAATSGQKVFVIDSDNYKKDLGTKDADQYVEHAIITHLKQGTNNRSEDESAADADRFMQTKLLNQYLIDASDNPTGGGGGLNPPYRLDPFQNIVNVQFGTYANRVIIVTDATPPNVHVTKDGWNWDDRGRLAYHGTGVGGPDVDPSFIQFGGWRRDIKKFAVSGVATSFDGSNFTNESFDMVSADGYAWAKSGADMDLDLIWSYSEKPMKRVVNGYVYRVAGNSAVGGPPLSNVSQYGRVDDNRYLDPSYARFQGGLIQRCANTSAKEDDDSQPWETVLTAALPYISFGPIEVIKGANDKPTLLCLVQLPNADSKFGVLASRDGVHFTLTFTGHVISHGGADPVGFAAARIDT